MRCHDAKAYSCWLIPNRSWNRLHDLVRPATFGRAAGRRRIGRGRFDNAIVRSEGAVDFRRHSSGTGATRAVSGTLPAAVLEADFPIAAPLNIPGSTIARDLEVVSQIFESWQSNFPREGNPVGENAEITAALMGDNRLGFALIPKGHRALNERGELCDRWGTPFRFHQLSGTKMEIRSAGPDRKFATDDDAIWTPQ
jgi:hypothetical protein